MWQTCPYAVCNRWHFACLPPSARTVSVTLWESSCPVSSTNTSWVIFQNSIFGSLPVPCPIIPGVVDKNGWLYCTSYFLSCEQQGRHLCYSKYIKCFSHWFLMVLPYKWINFYSWKINIGVLFQLAVTLMQPTWIFTKVPQEGGRLPAGLLSSCICYRVSRSSDS